MTKKFQLLLTLLILSLFISSSFAQISTPGTPFSTNHILKSEPQLITMPNIDINRLKEEDRYESQFKDIPPRFGFPFTVNYGMTNSGTYDYMPDGTRIWRLTIKCATAYAVNLIFNKFYLPAGSSMFVYNKENNYVLGAFTYSNNSPERVFSTAPVKGDEITIEYNAPWYVTEQPEINVSTVVHVYKDLFKMIKDYGQSGTCNRNVVCPEGDPYRDQIRSAVMLLTSSNTRFCSGSMINNTRNDGTPYMLTANHCWDASSNTWIVMFNYQSALCPNMSGDGPTTMTISGSTLMAKNAASDFCLIKLSSKPPVSYNVYYEGWNRSNVPATGGFCVHHPNCDVKKISFSTTAYTPTSYNNPAVPGDSSHWHVVWATIPSTGLTPITEPGSSGSPLYDQNKRIVGQLHGGPSSCSATDKSDYYGKFDRSWTGGGTPSTRLSDWLDSANTGVMFINGYDPNSGPLNSFNLQTPASGVTVLTIPGSSTIYSFNWDTSTASASYKWIFGNALPTRQLTVPLTTKPFNVTLGQLDAYIAGLGIPQGGSISGSWDVWAFRNNPPTFDSLKALNGPRTITFTRSLPALTAFSLVSPPNNSRIETQSGSTTPLLTNWTKSGAGTSYKWFYASPNFSSPANIKFRISSDNGGFDSLFTTTVGSMDALLSGIGVVMGDSSIGQWRVYAYSGADSLASSQTYNITFKRLSIATACIGNGTVQMGSSSGPFNTYWYGNRTNLLWTATEVLSNGGAVGNITKVGFSIATVGGQAMNGLTIRMQNTTLTALTGFTSTGWTTVYSNNYTVPGTGLQYIQLTTPFAWNGTNILMEICFQNTSYTTATVVNGTTISGMENTEYHDLSTACSYTGFTTPVAQTARANVCFVITPTTGINNNYGNIPTKYNLSQNYPNPFNPVTRISFDIPKQGFVSLKVYDIIGREVKTLVNEVKSIGYYTIDFNAGELASGVYFYKLESNDFKQVKRMILVK